MSITSEGGRDWSPVQRSGFGDAEGRRALRTGEKHKGAKSQRRDSGQITQQ